MTGLLPSETDCPGTSRSVDVGEVRLHTVVAGPDDGEPVVLLHGFPECWYAWHDIVEPLAAAGYRVFAPDQRGYNRSDKPEAVSAYHPDALAGDVSGLLGAVAAADAHVVGHDWGALVGRWLALHTPGRVRTLSALNVPHPAVPRRAVLTDPRQLLRSWYGGFFQLPRLPEFLARRNDWRRAVASMADTSRPEAFDATDFERYRRAWAVPDAFRSMIHWYRVVFRANARPRRRRVDPSTLVLWGAEDAFLRRPLAAKSSAYCDDGRLVLWEDATHWLHHEHPERVADELTRRFAAAGGS
ncbi:alpha/beta fold hydrolase [Halobellus ruber]|uniref:Alpha/beta hydrolase n=1 Tax=Halobellus ruber TaxID=2761102 RepID=A0A7J9SLD6_9EURY|nr:alpha/beta hydrolase [Halobellus ruber]MBB6647183.1 alpha/beta hydrolase [Halobellus ruber]